MVTVYVAAATVLPTVIVSVDEPDPPDTVPVLRAVVRPAFGTVTVRVTVPVNPLTGAMLIVAVPEFPAWIVTDAGLAEIVKLGLDAVIVNVAV